MSKEKQYLECFLCEGDCEIKMTKKDKPYTQCEACGIQIFFRLQAGIDRLNELIEEAE